MSNLVIYKDNYLVEASYKLTLLEQRLMIYCIGKLNPEKPEREQIIIIDDFVKQFKDIDKNSAYKQVKKAIETLYERSIKVKDPKRTKEFRWISSKEYWNDKGSASIAFSAEVMPYICQLEKQFTKYQLRNISAFKKMYSIRTYELLTQYRTIQCRVINLIDLRCILKLEGKFKIWSDLKKFVIDPSVEEINEKSDLLVEYELIKKGRSVDSIKFSIKEKSKIRITKSNKSNERNNERKGLKSINELAPEIQKHLDKIKAQLKK